MALELTHSSLPHCHGNAVLLIIILTEESFSLNYQNILLFYIIRLLKYGFIITVTSINTISIISRALGSGVFGAIISQTICIYWFVAFIKHLLRIWVLPRQHPVSLVVLFCFILWCVENSL